MKILSRAEWRATPEAPNPDLSFVPPMERRRLTPLERAALAVAHQALATPVPRSPFPATPVPRSPFPATPVPRSPFPVPLVFASRWGEIGTTFKLMRQLHEEGEMSPAGFSNSVHNAAPGHFSLLTKSKAPYTAIAAGADTYEMGLLEASTYPGVVLFVYAEESTPEFYRPYFADVQSAHAIALLLDNGR